MHVTGRSRRRRHRPSWQRARHIGLVVLVVVLTLEVVYRLVALPPDYLEQREAARQAELRAEAGPPAAAERLETDVAAIPPAALPAPRAAPEAGLRLSRRLDIEPQREPIRLPREAGPTIAAPFGTMADPALEAAPAPAAGPAPSPAEDAATALVALPIPHRPVQPPETALVAVVIDDMGYSPASLARLARLPGPLTLAFLPYAEGTARMLEAAGRGDFELRLHLPMQPLGDADPGPEALLVGLDDDEIRRRVRWGIERVPGAVGVNNHMGSRFTADAAGLAVVMAELRRHGLFFLDSRTNPASVAEREARPAGLPASSRDVFVDHDPEPQAIARQLALAERVAQRHGTVIAIGHPYPTTLEALEDWLPGLERRGFRLARVSEVVAARLCRERPRPEECGPGLHLVGSDATILPRATVEAAP